MENVSANEREFPRHGTRGESVSEKIYGKGKIRRWE